MVKPEALEGIVEFVASVECGSLSAAAEATATSVANVSRKVSALEARLEQQLLMRSARGCTPTDAGYTLYKSCRTLLDGMEESFDEMRPCRPSLRGEIKISLAGHFAEKQILPLLAQFCSAHPGISLSIGMIARNVDMVAENVDMCVRVGPLADSSLIARKLIDFPLRTLASPGLIERIGPVGEPRQLDPDQCLPFMGRDWNFTKERRRHRVEPAGRILSNSGVALIAAAVQDLGVIQVPSYYGNEALARGELEVILEDWQSADRFEFYLVFPPARYVPQRVRSLADFLRDRLAAESETVEGGIQHHK